MPRPLAFSHSSPRGLAWLWNSWGHQTLQDTGHALLYSRHDHPAAQSAPKSWYSAKRCSHYRKFETIWPVDPRLTALHPTMLLFLSFVYAGLVAQSACIYPALANPRMMLQLTTV